MSILYVIYKKIIVLISVNKSFIVFVNVVGDLGPGFPHYIEKSVGLTHRVRIVGFQSHLPVVVQTVVIQVGRTYKEGFIINDCNFSMGRNNFEWYSIRGKSFVSIRIKWIRMRIVY